VLQPAEQIRGHVNRITEGNCELWVVCHRWREFLLL
jgi:hypothetical protein